MDRAKQAVSPGDATVNRSQPFARFTQKMQRA